MALKQLVSRFVSTDFAVGSLENCFVVSFGYPYSS